MEELDTIDGLPILKKTSSTTDEGLPVFKPKPLPKSVDTTGAIFNPSQPQSLPLSPVVPEQRDAILAEQKDRADKVSSTLKNHLNALNPETRAQVEKIIPLASNQGEIKEVSPEEQNHYEFMQTPTGKALGAVAYLGKKATKGSVQVLKGAAYLADMGVNPVGTMAGVKSQAANGLDFVEEKATMGLTKGDENRIGSGAIMENLGGLAEFAPAMAGAASTGGATFYLQGLGQGKDAIESVEKQGVQVNPIVKNAFILGTGAVNGLLMGELGSSMFKTLPAGLRSDVTAKITADAIKKAAGKELTGEQFASLLDMGAKEFGDRLAQGGIQVLDGYKHAATNLGALTTADFLLKKGADIANDTPVFNESLGNLAENLTNVATKQAPFFTIPSALSVAGNLNRYTHNKNIIVEDLMRDSSPENIQKNKSELADFAQRNEWTPEETDKTFAQVDEIASVVKSLPKNLPDYKLTDAVDLVQGRRSLENELAAEQGQRKELDPALADIVTPKEQLLTDKIEQSNDKLRDIATNSRTTYSKGVGEEEGLFFKTVNGKKEEITPSRYELEKLERESRAEVEEPVVEETIAETPTEPIINEPSTPSPETPADVQGQPAEPIIAQENSPEVVETPVEENTINYESPSGKGASLNIQDINIEDKGEGKFPDGGSVNTFLFTEKGNRIGHLQVAKNGDGTASIKLSQIFNPALQRKGIGTVMYEKVANTLKNKYGLDLVSDVNRTKDAEALWSNPEKQGKAEIIGKKSSDTKDYRYKYIIKETPSEEASKPQGTGGEATQGNTERQPSLNEQELNRKLELRKKFAGRFNDVTNIPTLLADKEFREYAGLVLKEATGDFKAFSKELIDNIGEKIKPHLDKLFAELSEEKTRPSKNGEMGDRAFELGIELKDAKEKSRGEDVVEKEASAKIKDGYDVYELIDKIVKDKQGATDTEVAILNKYIDAKEGEIRAHNERLGKEGATMGKKDFMDLMDAKTKAEMEFQDAAYAAERTGRITAQALNARKFRFNKENSLSNMIGKKRQALGGDKLSPEQLSDITAKYTEMESLLKAKEARLAKLESDNAKLKAEQAVKKTTTERASRKSVTKEQLAIERKEIAAEFSEKLKKMRSQGLNSEGKALAEFLIAATPYVAKMTRNLAQEGVVEIKDLVVRIKSELGIDDISDLDVMDMIAGKYNEPKETKSGLQDNIRSLRLQAKLLSEINRLENGLKGETKAKTIKAKNEQIEALKSRLKELNKGEEVNTYEKDLAAVKKRIQGNIDKLSKRIADGDYSKAEKKEPVKPDAEVVQLQRKYDKIKREFDLQVARDFLEQRSKNQKIIDGIVDVTAIPRALKSSFDFSAAGRQGLFLAPHLGEVKTAFKEMFGQAFSETKYDNWISDLKHTPMYDLMKESGLYIADKSDPKLEAREEAFTSNLAEKIPFGIGKGVKISERAYTAYLNVLRTGVFQSESSKLMARGYTPEAHPKEFKSLARVINILSGRGEIPKSWGHSAPKILSLGLFSPRFLAARLQTLYLWADPTLSKNAKILAAKDIGSVLASAVTLMTLASLAGYKVATDPTSTNFLKIQDEQENGSTYYDILGGLPQYVRILAQMATGKTISATGNVTELSAERGTENPFGTTRLDVLGRFGRGKLAPVPGMAFNLLDGKDVVGQPYGAPQVLGELVPLPFSDVTSAFQVGGIDNALKVLIPTQFGIGASSY